MNVVPSCAHQIVPESSTQRPLQPKTSTMNMIRVATSLLCMYVHTQVGSLSKSPAPKRPRQLPITNPGRGDSRKSRAFFSVVCVPRQDTSTANVTLSKNTYLTESKGEDTVLHQAPCTWASAAAVVVVYEKVSYTAQHKSGNPKKKKEKKRKEKQGKHFIIITIIVIADFNVGLPKTQKKE